MIPKQRVLFCLLISPHPFYSFMCSCFFFYYQFLLCNGWLVGRYTWTIKWPFGVPRFFIFVKFTAKGSCLLRFSFQYCDLDEIQAIDVLSIKIVVTVEVVLSRRSVFSDHLPESRRIVAVSFYLILWSFHRHTTVWSASSNGQIIGWDPVTLTAKKEVRRRLMSNF